MGAAQAGTGGHPEGGAGMCAFHCAEAPTGNTLRLPAPPSWVSIVSWGVCERLQGPGQPKARARSGGRKARQGV